MSAEPFVTRVPVRWSDFDRYGHVNNISYLNFAQEARVHLVRDSQSAGAPLPPMVVRSIRVDYLRALLPDTVEVRVESEITRIGRTSYTLRQTISDGHDNAAAVVDTVMVFVDLDTASPMALTPSTRQMLQQFASDEATGDADSEPTEHAPKRS